jgi:magnesium transporter
MKNNQYKYLKERQIGRSPGIVEYVGHRDNTPSQIKIISYNENICIESKILSPDDIEIKDDSKVYWIDLLGLSDIDVIKKLGIKLSIDSLILEDVVNTNLKPSITFIDDTIHCTMKIVRYEENNKDLIFEHIAIIAKNNFIITFQEISDDSFIYILNRLQKQNSRIRKKKNDYLFYSIINLILESQAKALYQVGYHIEELSEQILLNSNVNLYKELIGYKRQLIRLKKVIRPVEEIIFELKNYEHDFFTEDNEVYLNDLIDHTKQVESTLDEVYDSLNLAYDTYVSSLNIRMNDIIRTLTIISTLFIPLTFVAGVYGMNFKNMPELSMQYGYHATLFLMLLIGTGFIIYFKFKKWF